MRLFPKSINKLIFSSIFCLTTFSLFAQPLEVTNAPPITPENLISNVFLGEGVEVVDINFEGTGSSVGFFKNGEDEVGISRGIVMTTGAAVTAGLDIGINSPGSSFASVNNMSTVNDPDLNSIAIGSTVNNVTRYTISFIPISDTLRFRYAFGSEEYPEYTCSQYNDIFGFFISGPGINGPYQNNAENIARVPGTNLPVTINNVNSGAVGTNGTLINCTPPNGSLAFSQYYNDNDGGGGMPVYDGLTDVFTAEAIVQPCSIYTIKLVIADVADGAFDSGVFLEAKSFGTGSLNVETTTVSLDGSVAEGCAEGLLTFSLPTRVESDFPIDYTILGTAENGVDYEFIPPDLFIPAGDSVLVIPIIALEDGILEGEETLLVDVQKDVCNRDTVSILLRDNPLVPPNLRPDTTICQGQSLNLDGTLDVPLPVPPAFSNTNDLLIDPVNVPVFSNVQVNGVIPDVLGPGVIKSICIDSLSHRWIDDIDVYLIAPGGQFIELTTDNGGNGGNLFGFDYYLNTCFTEDAETIISAPGPFAPPEAVPFTGNWQPEGVWEDLWGGPTNGTWQLQLIDDTQSIEGTIHSWTICFNPIYDIKYSWTPTAGLSCADCPDPVATPDTTTTYYLEASDSYGCTVYDTITIEVMPAPDLQNLICGTVTGSSISIAWDETPNALDYEVSVDGGPWVSTGGLLTYKQTGLTFSQTVTFEVRSIADCPGLPATIQCSTPDCIPPGASASTTMTSCFQGQDGTVIITATGGVSPYQYSLNGVENTTGEFNNLSAGNYVAVVLDAANCPLNVQFTIGEPEGMDISTFVLSPISCNGVIDGEIMASVNGGTGPFDYLWSTGDGDATVTNLGAGTYYVTITDGNNCMQVDSIELPEPAVLELSLIPTDVTCAGANDGFAVAIPQGGVEPYTFLWDTNANSQTTDTAFTLSGGTYSVVVTDANDCQIQLPITINENEPLVISLTTQDASCAGSADGAATVSPSGGSGDFNFQWLNLPDNSILGDEANIDILPGGNYRLVVTDTDGCSITEDFTIDAPQSIEYMLTTEAPLCFNGNDGTAILTPSGGTPGYTYQWSDMGPALAERSDLSAGTYTLTISDAQDCSIEVEVVVPSTSPIELSFDATAISCFEGADGTATVTAIGGTGSYVYLWENGQDSPTATGLQTGMLGVTVTDSNGCEIVGSTLVDSATPLQLSIDGTNPYCNGEDSGMAEVTAAGGTGVYTYLWNNGQTGTLATDLVAGTYEVTVTDSNDCEAIISTVLDNPPVLTADLFAEEVSCNGVPDGTATAQVTGGTAPYTYSWNDTQAQNTSTATGLDAGSYSVTITDASNCVVVETVEVTSSAQVIISLQAGAVSCNGGSDGTITVSATGGTGVYNYTWNPSVGNTANPVNLPAGLYTVSVTDSNDCLAVESIEVEQPSPIVLETLLDPVICAGGSDGAIDLMVSGGVSPYNYRWNNNSNEEDLEDITAGAYSVVVTDANGCQATLQANIPEPEVLEASFEIEKVDCFGEANGAILTSIRGGVPPYDFDWSNGAGGAILEQLPAGEYILNLTDDNGCTLESIVTVPQPEAPLGADIATEDISCFDGRDGLISIEATGGTPGYTFSLDGHNYVGTRNMIGLEEGSYRVFIRDFKGCEFVSDEIIINQPNPLQVDLGPNLTILYGKTVDLMAEVSGANGMVFYEWTPQDSSKISCFDCPNPRVSVDGQTSFKLRIRDENGCSAEDIITIFVSKERGVMVPTGFSPNGDLVNDRLLVHGRKETKVLSFKVFDRWGELLYEGANFDINDPSTGWDGNFRGKPANAGVYVWTVTVEYVDGATESISGSTTLIR